MKKSIRDRMIAARRFVNRLAKDVAGNTLAMVAISIIPVAAMIGSGVDMSRAYLVKSRLQQACDAGALAGRRAMTGPTLDSASEAQARNLFTFNFPAGTMGTTNLIFTPTHTVDANGNAAGQVTATASVTVPTSIMKMFGKETIDVAVSCDAKLEIANTDIMFVLDVTGSMNCNAADTEATCTNNGNVEKTDARIKALRTAVVSFYDTMAAAADSSARLRFGFVPYSSGVNVGYLLPKTYIVDSHVYQSRHRIPDGTYSSSSSSTSWSNSGSQTAWSTWTTYQHTANDSTTSNNCQTPVNTNSNGSVSSTAGTSSTDSNGVITTPWSDQRTVTITNYRWTWGVNDTNGNKRDCMKESRTATQIQTRTTTVTQTPNTTWKYEPWSFDTSTFKMGTSVTTQTGSNGSNVSSTWNGCIEERDTVAQSTFTTIPSNAYDLDIDLKPSSDATKWRPIWPEVVFDRNTSSNSTASETTSTNRSNEGTYCPKAAERLDVKTHDQVYNYVNGSDFKAIGSTYHDFGMIWGARLLSPTGIFDVDNATAPNGKPINRHIVFMTDGDMKPSTDLYTAYGFERLDRRVSGTSNVPTASDLKSRHNARFSAICEAARTKNITIWVVAYAQSMTTELQNCADPGKSFYASNDTQLQQQFQLIAQRIARLRLSK